MSATRPAIDELHVGDHPEAWAALGFRVEDGACAVGTVRVRLLGDGAGRGVVAWSMSGVEADDLDGLPVERSGAPRREPAPAHPNGVSAIDHLVSVSPDLDRTVGALEAAGLDLRRLRDEPAPTGAPRQAFFRLREVILEVLQHPDPEARRDRPLRLVGLAFLCQDLDALAARLGDRLGQPHDAVQPGRRIATLRRSAGLGEAVAFMTPGPGAA